MSGSGSTDPAPIDAAEVVAGVVIDVGGVALGLTAADRARGEAVASLFRHATRTAAPAAATLRCAVEPVAVPATAPTTVTPDVELWADEPGRLVARSRTGLTVRADAHALVIGGDAPALGREVRFVTILGLTHLLARHDRHLLHGAAWLVDAGAIVVVGPTATGKSTLAYAAHRAGVPVLGDDTVLVRRAGGGVRVQGVPRPIAVAADVVDAGPGAVVGGRRVPDDYRDRTELAAGTLAVGEFPVVALAVTTGADDRGSGLDPLPGVDALRAVLRASVSIVDADARPELFAVAGALARLPAWSLRHGSDPAAAVADATALVAALQGLLAGGS